MSDPFERAKGGRLTFKGGDLATRSKSIDKKKKKKNKNKKISPDEAALEFATETTLQDDSTAAASGGGETYTIDAAKRMKYEDLFPVEAKKFGYEDPKSSNFNSFEDALDARVKKKADRYCK